MAGRKTAAWAACARAAHPAALCMLEAVAPELTGKGEAGKGGNADNGDVNGEGEGESEGTGEGQSEAEGEGRGMNEKYGEFGPD